MTMNRKNSRMWTMVQFSVGVCAWHLPQVMPPSRTLWSQFLQRKRRMIWLRLDYAQEHDKASEDMHP